MPKDRNYITDSVIDDELIERTKKYERYVPHMYVDSTGNVTAGYGRMLENDIKAVETLFRVGESEGDRYATPSENKDAYARIKKRPLGNFAADYYAPDNQDNSDLAKIYLNEKDAADDLQKSLSSSEEELVGRWRDFESYPRSARKAMTDLQFNMGTGRFSREVYENGKLLPNKGWPELFNAIDAKDWKKAAKESSRTGLNGNNRNKDIYDLFMKAADQ